jgi:hypothetical protein
VDRQVSLVRLETVDLCGGPMEPLLFDVFHSSDARAFMDFNSVEDVAFSRRLLGTSDADNTLDAMRPGLDQIAD